MFKYVKLALIPISFLLAACAPNLSANNYNASQVGVANKAVSGVVVDKRVVNIDNNSGVGGVAGTVAGAAAGSTIGGSTASNIVGGVGGALVGGLLGNAVDKSIHAQQGYQYIVKLNKNQTIAVTQTLDSNFRVGQHVLVIYGDKTRLIPDNS